MTCIVGIAHEGKVILGGDSAGVGGYDRRIRCDRKVFTNGELILGGTTSFRMLQLLQFNLTPPPITEGQEAYAYAVKALVPAIRDTLKAGGFATLKDGGEIGGLFMVGFRGRLFVIHSDYQVAESVECFEAVGCGDAYAMGAMHAFKPADKSLEQAMARLQAGLDAAAAFSAGVAGPFHFVTLEKKA